MTPAGFSHSEISGSKPVCDSPELIAANYVLHRHLTPRHPSCALGSLTANLGWTVVATINYRDTPSQTAIPLGTAIPAPGRPCGGLRMRFKVEIEARLASSKLWIPSTLVFLLFSRTTLSRPIRLFTFQRSPLVSSTTGLLASPKQLRRCSSLVYFGGA